MAGTKVAGYTVSLHGTAINATDVARGSRTLVRAAIDNEIEEFSYVAASEDGAGLVVAIPQTALPLAEEARLRSQLSAKAGLPVAIRFGEPAVTPVDNRQANSQAWKGGAAWWNEDSPGGAGYCSVAFAVQFAGGGRRMLAARHCNPNNNIKMATPAGVHFANAGANQVLGPGDTMLINPDGDPGGKIFTGDLYSGTKELVLGAGSPSMGGSVCTGGANSGEHCNLTVIDYVTLNCYGNICNIWKARDQTGTYAGVVGGDSGGPVYRNVSGGVRARGVIYGGQDHVTCPATVVNPGINPATELPKCYRTAWFTDVSTLMQQWNVTIVIGT